MENTNTFQVGKDKDRRIKYYRGRNGEIYDVLENVLQVYYDEPGGEKPYSVIFYNFDAKYFTGGYMTEEDFQKAQEKYGPVGYYDSNIRSDETN